MSSKKPTIANLQQQITDLTDALQRERADVINVRRRHDEQLGSLRTMVKANVVRELLPVIDNFERALKHVPANSGQLSADNKNKQDSEWTKGMMTIKAQFDTTLKNMSVERIKTVGEVFDPKYHEAVSMDDSSGGSVELVCEELQPGYKIGNDIIRHSMVKVKMEKM